MALSGQGLAAGLSSLPEYSPTIALEPHPLPDPPLEREGEKSKFRLSGTLETYGAFYPQKQAHSDYTGYIEERLLQRLLLIHSDRLLLYMQGDLRIDSAGLAQGLGALPVERSGRQPIADLREGYLEYSDTWYRLRAGKQIFDWSVTDTVSPADALSPRDLTDFIRWERIGTPALDVRVGGDTFVQFVYLPWFAPSRIPTGDNRWATLLPEGVTYAEQSSPRQEEGQFAVRGGMTTGGFDFGASYFYGYSFSPLIRIVPLSSATFNAQPYYQRNQIVAVSVAGGVMGYNLRAETGYIRQQNQDDFIQYVVGIDRDWSGLIRPTDSLYALAQYANELKIGRDSLEDTGIDFRRVFNNSLLGKLKYTFTEPREWGIRCDWTANMSNGSGYMEPALTWERSPFNIEAGYGWLLGDKETFWGSYSDNSRVFVKGMCRF